MYEVIGNTASRALRVLWMLEEIGEPYTHIAEKPHTELVLSLNPTGKIPALKDGDAVITDSTAILTYLADKNGKLTAPAGTVKRAQQDAMTHRILDELEALIWTGTRHAFILPKENRVPEVKTAMKWEFARNLSRLAETFEGPFIMGDEMTITDIIFTHLLNWGYGAKFPMEEANLLAYAKEMRARPAYKRAAGK